MKLCCSDELWKQIPDFPNYEISTCGRVRSYHRMAPGGWSVADRPQRILSTTTNGYPQVNIKHKSGEFQVHRVHYLVMLTFHGPRPDGCEVCHNDGNCRNNHLVNLRYDTAEANILDAIEHGSYYRTFSPAEVRQIRKQYNAGGITASEIAREHNCHRQTVADILRGRKFLEAGGPVVKRLRHRSQKLTRNEVRRVRRIAKTKDITYKQLGEMFGITASMAWRIVKGERWANVNEGTNGN